MVPVDPDVPFSFNAWKSIEPIVLREHAKFLANCSEYVSREVLPRLCLQWVFFDPNLQAGVIEAKPTADPVRIRDLFLTRLDLHIRMKVLLHHDQKNPIVYTFAPQVYQIYDGETYLNQLKLLNPILEEDRFCLHKTVKKDTGVLYSFITTAEVVEHIVSNNYVLEHTLGQTIFNKKIDYVTSSDHVTRLPGSSSQFPVSWASSGGLPAVPSPPVTSKASSNSLSSDAVTHANGPSTSSASSQVLTNAVAGGAMGPKLGAQVHPLVGSPLALDYGDPEDPMDTTDPLTKGAASIVASNAEATEAAAGEDEDEEDRFWKSELKQLEQSVAASNASKKPQ
jgi:hypothetical protein